MRRRAFIAATAAGAIWPYAASGQQAGRAYRIGVLANTSPGPGMQYYDAFRDELRLLGFVEPRDVVLEFRWAGGKLDRLPALAKELVERGVDMLFAGGTEAARAAKAATTTLPIVFSAIAPVENGLVESVSRPGGNLTGAATFPNDTIGKQIEVLKETLPDLARVATLGFPRDLTYPPFVASAQRRAQELGLRLDEQGLRDISEVESVFNRMAAGGHRALVVFPHLVVLASLGRIARLALAHTIATAFAHVDAAAVGALYAFGPDLKRMFRLAARQAAKIIKGAAPGDLPIEQPTDWLFAVNLATARALGIVVPPPLLVRADMVIE